MRALAFLVDNSFLFELEGNIFSPGVATGTDTLKTRKLRKETHQVSSWRQKPFGVDSSMSEEKKKTSLRQSTLQFPTKTASTTAKRTRSAERMAAAAASERPPLSSILPLNLPESITDDQWKEQLDELFRTSGYEAIERFLASEYDKGKKIFPKRQDIFNAFNCTPFDQVRVVLIGQDPYHDDNQAHGLCFSVLPGIKPPPSLNNMYKELVTDIPGFVPPHHGYLVSWANQGVLMLNATLTVEAHAANSHSKIGWQTFTDGVIRKLNMQPRPLVFLLWGGFAQKKGKILNRTKHVIIECAHPSPLSAHSWFGCGTFSKCNEALKKLGQPSIDWGLPRDPTDLWRQQPLEKVRKQIEALERKYAKLEREENDSSFYPQNQNNTSSNSWKRMPKAYSDLFHPMCRFLFATCALTFLLMDSWSSVICSVEAHAITQTSDFAKEEEAGVPKDLLSLPGCFFEEGLLIDSDITGGSPHLLVEPWGPNTLRVRATAPRVPFNDGVPSALFSSQNPSSSSLLSRCTDPASLKKSGLPNHLRHHHHQQQQHKLSQGSVVRNGNIYAIIDPELHLISFFRTSDKKLITREVHRSVPHITSNESCPCCNNGGGAEASVSFSAHPTDEIYGFGQGVPLIPYPTIRTGPLNHKGDNISFRVCVANEGGAGNCLPWYMLVSNTNNSTNATTTQTTMSSNQRNVEYGFLWNVPSFGGVFFDKSVTRWSSDAAFQIDYLIMVPEVESSSSSTLGHHLHPHHSGIKSNMTADFNSLMNQYTKLVGRANPSLPDSLLGYWHSKNAYRTQEELMEAFDGFVQRRIPVDVFIIDIGGSKGKVEGDWSFNPAQFPDPSAMTAKLASYNTRVMVSVWGGTDINSTSFVSLVKNRWVVENRTATCASSKNGNPFDDLNGEGTRAKTTTAVARDEGSKFVPIPWPLACGGPECFLYDASNPDARAYVWSRIRAGYVKHNITLFWLDGSEPQPPFPGDYTCQQFNQGSYKVGPVVQAGMAFAKWHSGTFFEGFQRDGLKESVTLARSSWFGSSAHGSALWSGDTLSDWQTLKRSVKTGLGAQLTGIAWWTTDVGGYRCWNTSTMPDSELVVRWFQFGFTCPILRQHGHRPETVPWAYGPEAEAAIVKVIRLRAALKGYLRVQHDILSSKGIPFNRPLWWDFPHDPNVWSDNDEDNDAESTSTNTAYSYMMGQYYLVAPVLAKGVRWKLVYLPKGPPCSTTRFQKRHGSDLSVNLQKKEEEEVPFPVSPCESIQWKHYFSGKIYEGGQSYNVSVPLDELPLFEKKVCAGRIT